MYFVFGMAVIGSDSAETGTLERVLVDPNKRQVTHVVVRSEQVSEELLLPLSLIQGTDANTRLLLYLASGEIGNMPRYYEGRVSSPPAGRVDTSTAVVNEPAERQQTLSDAMNVPEDAIELGPDTEVATADGAKGKLLGIGTGQYVDRITEIRVGGIGDRPADVPESYLGRLDTDRIMISAGSAQLEHLSVPAAGAYLPVEEGPQSSVAEAGES